MQWILLSFIILSFTAIVTVTVFTLRTSYLILLDRITALFFDLKTLTDAHINAYEHLYGLLFFFGNDKSAEKIDFDIPEDPSLQDLFDISHGVSHEFSLLLDRAAQSESLVKERSNSLKITESDFTALETDFITSVLLINEKISSAERYRSIVFSKYLLSGLGECRYSQIKFPE